MELGDLLELLVEHAQLTLVAWAAGVGVGGVLGAAVALLLRRVFARAPWLRGWAALVPWRAIALLVPLPLAWLIWTFRYGSLHFGIGWSTGAIVLGVCLLVLSMPLVAATIVDYRQTVRLTVRLWGGARTLALVSFAVALVPGTLVMCQGAACEYQMMLVTLRWQAALDLFAQFVLAAVVVDVLLGAVQWGLLTRSGSGRSPVRAAQAAEQVV